MPRIITVQARFDVGNYHCFRETPFTAYVELWQSELNMKWRSMSQCVLEDNLTLAAITVKQQRKLLITLTDSPSIIALRMTKLC